MPLAGLVVIVGRVGRTVAFVDVGGGWGSLTYQSQIWNWPKPDPDLVKLRPERKLSILRLWEGHLRVRGVLCLWECSVLCQFSAD
jgi:hypothetical protein